MTGLQEIIRAADLFKYVGLRRTQVQELVAVGEFPAPIKLSDNGRAKGWLKCDVQAWQARRIEKSRGA
jgi:predicted DNA-binding transcriptional regulator AlpA